jgi:hypothetical protein
MADFCLAREFSAFIVGKLGKRRTLIIVYHISEVISAAVMGFSHTHGVVGEVDIAVVALELLVGVYMETFERSEPTEECIAS